MSDQCAVGPNGALLDASQIVWYNDPDDDNPIIATTSSTAIATPASSGASSVPTLNAFDILRSARKTSSSFIPSSRRSTRVSKPSAKLRDKANAELPNGKRKAVDVPSGRQVSRRIFIGDSDDAASDNSEPVDKLTNIPSHGPSQSITSTNGDEENDIHKDPHFIEEDDLTYEQLKSLGDSDKV
jgi:hypothetical protein